MTHVIGRGRYGRETYPKRSTSNPTVSGSIDLTYTSINDGANQSQSGTVTGAAVGDVVQVSSQGGLADGISIANAYVTAANTVAVQLTNASGGAFVPGTITFHVVCTHI